MDKNVSLMPVYDCFKYIISEKYPRMPSVMRMLTREIKKHVSTLIPPHTNAAIASCFAFLEADLASC